MKVKRLFNVGMVIMMLVTSFAVSQPVAAEAPVKFTPRIVAGAETVPGEVVVAFADSQGKNLVEKIEQAVETANDTGGQVTRLSMDGSAVIQVDGDTSAALSELNAQSDVLYAEPNYVFSAPTTDASTDTYNAASDFVFQEVTPSESTNWKSIMAIPNSTIQSMVAMGSLPSDTYLSTNQGWFNVGANIVWPNPTPSTNICEIDTGVDYLHPDLSYTYTYAYTYYVKYKRKWVPVTGYATATAYRIIPAYDFVNADSDPMDDNGHGTHVAGIMVAQPNNGIGISGVSPANVVAVKALDAQGAGTNFDIAAAIQYCADRTDVSVINLSLGGPAASTAIKNALLYATSTKGKLVVAAAGNGNSQTPTYPAAYAIDPAFPTNSILSVGATGKDNGGIDYSCRSLTSNYGNWVTVAAPGLDIYSTTPYDRPFYQNYYGHLNTRYDYMSGTSMAAAFVSAAAARRMGYKPLETNAAVGTVVRNSGDAMTASCTPAEMLTVKRVNVATLLDRTALRVSAFDAASGTPLDGGYIAVSYMDDLVSSIKYAMISTTAFQDSVDPDPTRYFVYYGSSTDVLDVPTVSTSGAPISNYSLLLYKAGYTNGWQPAFQQESIPSLPNGKLNIYLNGAVPPATSNFDIVLGWKEWNQFNNPADATFDDLDQYLWLPNTPKSPDINDGQPAPFIVGYGGDAFGFMEGDPYGTMNVFPFARLKREGGFTDSGPHVESTSLMYRPTNSYLPYYTGTYTVLATDYGQTIDHDKDGCGDNFGFSFKVPGNQAGQYAPGPECGAGKTLGIPMLGAYYTPYVYVWKDGVVQYFQDGSNNFGPFAANSSCNKHWWKAFSITTDFASVAPTYTPSDTCDNGQTAGFLPYSGYASNGDRLYVSGLGK